MKCPYCNEEISENLNTCPNCGYNLIRRDSFLFKLIHKKDGNIAKSRIISAIVFIVVFLIGITGSTLDITYFIASVIVGLMFAVPVFAVGKLVGWIIKKL